MGQWLKAGVKLFVFRPSSTTMIRKKRKTTTTATRKETSSELKNSNLSFVLFFYVPLGPYYQNPKITLLNIVNSDFTKTDFKKKRNIFDWGIRGLSRLVPKGI